MSIYEGVSVFWDALEFMKNFAILTLAVRSLEVLFKECGPKYVKSIELTTFSLNPPNDPTPVKSNATPQLRESPVCFVTIHTFFEKETRTFDIRNCEIINDPGFSTRLLLTTRGEEDVFVINLRRCRILNRTVHELKANPDVQKWKYVIEDKSRYEQGALPWVWLDHMNALSVPDTANPKDKDLVLIRRLFAFHWVRANGQWSIPNVLPLEYFVKKQRK